MNAFLERFSIRKFQKNCQPFTKIIESSFKFALLFKDGVK